MAAEASYGGQSMLGQSLYTLHFSRVARGRHGGRSLPQLQLIPQRSSPEPILSGRSFTTTKIGRRPKKRYFGAKILVLVLNFEFPPRS